MLTVGAGDEGEGGDNLEHHDCVDLHDMITGGVGEEMGHSDRVSEPAIWRSKGLR